MKTYSLRQATHLLRHVFKLYRKKKGKLLSSQRERILHSLESLQAAILSKNPYEVSHHAQELEKTAQNHLKKSFPEKFLELTLSLVIAFIFAFLIRQMWFEIYEIPTGSMRPTFKEKDRLIVSKSDFAINLPLTTRHLTLDPQLLTHGEIIIFTVEGMDVPNPDMMYFYIFPGKKQYVKRLMGKPGDRVYFYGGKLYGIDANGKDISAELQDPILGPLEYIPFLKFQNAKNSGSHPFSLLLLQMNQPIAQLMPTADGKIQGELLSPSSPNGPKDFGDLWGIKNFAMVRLLTPEQAQAFGKLSSDEAKEGLLFFELTHHPSLHNPQRIYRQDTHFWEPSLSTEVSYLPLQNDQIERIRQHIYTSRFIVHQGKVFRYESATPIAFQPTLEGIPDGCYEFYYGKAYQIGWGGLAKELPPIHPIYHWDVEKTALFFNLGIEWDTRFLPKYASQSYVPSRYGYFRDGALYFMGAPIFSSNDFLLKNFQQREREKRISNPYYLPFEAGTPPLLPDGQIDAQFLNAYGLKIPDHAYFALGDNHAMSGDSRVFGFVPEGNLRGKPLWIFWPFGSRWGAPPQTIHANLSIPNLLTWAIVLIGVGSWSLYYRRKNRLPIDFSR